MKKWLGCVCACLLVVATMQQVCAQTYYYRLDSYGNTGDEYHDVSGGQFITFKNAICLETDKKGVPVGHGYLRRVTRTPNIYIGSSYWGKNTKFQFTSDKSGLKVFSPNGVVYSYSRREAPINATTCSLIRSGSSNGYSPAPSSGGRPVQRPQQCGICYGTGKCSNCNGTGISHFGHAHVCGACGGNGKCGTCNGSGYSGTVTEYIY